MDPAAPAAHANILAQLQPTLLRAAKQTAAYRALQGQLAELQRTGGASAAEIAGLKALVQAVIAQMANLLIPNDELPQQLSPENTARVNAAVGAARAAAAPAAGQAGGAKKRRSTKRKSTVSKKKSTVTKRKSTKKRSTKGRK